MIFLVAAAVLAVLFISYFVLVLSDWDWRGVGVFWALLAPLVLIVALIINGVREIRGQ